jgi:hypothetical protein
MAAIERIADWIDILEEHEQDVPLELCPTEVVHLLFDLHIIRETVLAYERHLDVYNTHCQCASVDTGLCHSDAEPVT